MKIDKIDKKILFELSKNSRESLNNIGKKVNLSKSSLLYRIKKLEENKIIYKYHTFINHSYLGKLYGRVAFNLFNISIEKLEESINLLKKLEEISWLGTTQGKYDLCLGICVKSIKELYQTINKIYEIIGKHVRHQDISLAYKIYNCASNVIFEEFLKPVESFYTENYEKTNEFDIELINELQNNSKINIIELSNRLNVSTKKIISHKKELEKTKKILRYSILIDTIKLEYSSYHIFWKFNNFDIKEIEKLKKYLLSLKKTIYIVESVSSSDIETEFLVQNQRELYDLLFEIKNKFSNLISHYDVMLIKEVFKNNL